MNTLHHPSVKTTWLILKYTYGILAITAGTDKFFNFITAWEQYYSPLITNYLPAKTFGMVAGGLEIAVGVLILSRYTRLGAYIASGWLLGIAFNLVSMGTFFDIAVRDVVLSVGALALAWLSPDVE